MDEGSSMVTSDVARQAASWPSVPERPLLRVLLAIVFAGAGIAKLAGIPWMTAPFHALGAGPWLLYGTALAELAGASMLLAQGTAGFAAILLLPVMLGALVTEVAVMHRPPVIAIACLAGLLLLIRDHAPLTRAYIRRIADSLRSRQHGNSDRL
jgi:hypothetical protein